MKLRESHKNATYLRTTTFTKFIKEISKWMRNLTLSNVRKCNNVTLLLEKSTYESNRSNLSLIARKVEHGEVVNHSLDLLHLRRGDATTIFKSVTHFLICEEINITTVRFAGMDGCTIMVGEHSDVKALFSDATLHFVYVHCRNHCLALCFAHLFPQFSDFKEFDVLLLNFYLLLKNTSDETHRRDSMCL